MKTKPLGLALLLALPLVAAGLALAQGTAVIDWWVVGGGGGPAGNGGEITIEATLGQAVIGPSSADAASLGAGYWYGGTDPTAVTLARFEATPVGGDMVVEWETATEMDTLGFNLYRGESAGGPYAKLNGALIPSQTPGVPTGASYAWVDEDVEAGIAYYYLLEDVDVQGQAVRHGPVQATVPPGYLYRIYLPLVSE
jgi:hypothetical protein